MTQRNFTAQIDAWVAKSKRRTEAVFKQSAQAVIERARKNTPVITGSLRASLTSSLNAPVTDIQFRPPAGESVPDDGGAQIAATIASAELGDTIFAVYVMNYAVVVEYGRQGREGHGMVRRAAQEWPSIVASVTAEAKARVG